MGLSDATAPPLQGLWLLLGGCSCFAARPWCRASQVPGGSICARCLLSPRRVLPVRLVEASGLMLASPLLEGWPLSVSFNEAESSSRDTTARAFAASGFDQQDCSRQPQSWLHDFRPFIMMNTSQFTRATGLSWRTRRKRREPRPGEWGIRRRTLPRSRSRFNYLVWRQAAGLVRTVRGFVSFVAFCADLSALRGPRACSMSWLIQALRLGLALAWISALGRRRRTVMTFDFIQECVLHLMGPPNRPQAPTRRAPRLKSDPRWCCPGHPLVGGSSG
jgi:hypothetical protein